MTLHEITRKLAGPINPVGETDEDQTRLRNLEKTIELIDRLMFDVDGVKINADRPEASMCAIGKRAKQFLDDLRDSLS